MTLERNFSIPQGYTARLGDGLIYIHILPLDSGWGYKISAGQETAGRGYETKEAAYLAALRWLRLQLGRAVAEVAGEIEAAVAEAQK